MMLSRSDRSSLSIWLWTIDKWIFFSFLTLLILGIIFILTSSSTLELKLNKDSYHFSMKHVVFVIFSFLIAIILSKLNFHKIKLLSLISFILLLSALLYSIQFGSDIKKEISKRILLCSPKRLLHIISFPYVLITLTLLICLNFCLILLFKNTSL